MKTYYVYILSNKHRGTLYIGVTNDLQRRILNHKEGILSGFTRKYSLKKLIYFEEFQSIIEAIRREKQLKNWQRNWKIDLIEKQNPLWKDLAVIY